MKLKCKHGFYTCSNLIEKFHFAELCDNCDQGENYQHKDDLKTL